MMAHANKDRAAAVDKTQIIKSHPSLLRLFVFVSPNTATAASDAATTTPRSRLLCFNIFIAWRFVARKLYVYLGAPPVLCFHYQHATLDRLKLYSSRFHVSSTLF